MTLLLERIRYTNHAFGLFKDRAFQVLGNARRGAFRAAILSAGLVAGFTILSSNASASCGHKPATTPAANAPFAGKSFVHAGAIPAPAAPVSVVGLWHVFLVSGGQPFDEGFEQWHSDGTEIFNDTAPPQAANGSGAVCLGVYEKTGSNTYKLKHLAWIFDANANLVNIAIIKEEVTLNSGGSSYDGTFIFDVFDLSGNLVFEATGTVNATRITAD